MSQQDIDTITKAIEAHLETLQAKPTKAEAKAWARKYNSLSSQLEALKASDPNRKHRAIDDTDEDNDDNNG